MTDVEVPQQPMTTSEKFELLIKDMSTLMDTTKSLSARMKVLQKEVSKGKRNKRQVETDPDAPKRVSALYKPVSISNELCKFLGLPADTETSRRDVTQGITDYIKKHDLQDPNNRRFITLDGKPEALALKVLLRDPDQPVTFFNIQRYLKPHFPLSEKDKKALESEAQAAPAPAPAPAKGKGKKAPLPELEVVADSAVVEDSAPKVEPPKAPPKKRVVRNPKTA